MQHVLKSASGAAGTQVIAAELFDELLIAVHDAIATTDACL
jgi:hypothetical protein